MCIEFLDFSINLHKVLATSLSKAGHADGSEHWRWAVADRLESRFHCTLPTDKHTRSIINAQASSKLSSASPPLLTLHYQHLS